MTDIRGVVAIGVLLLVAMIFGLLAWIPELRGDGTFKDLAILVVGSGGFGIVLGWLFGGSKTGSQAVEKLEAPAPASPPGTTTITASPDVDVSVREVAQTEDRPPWQR